MQLPLNYELKDGPSRIDYEYVDSLKKEFQSIVESPKDEKQIQEFFEEVPSFLPVRYSKIHHGSNRRRVDMCWHRYIMISQPGLPGLSKEYIPDFMYIARDSKSWKPVMVELKLPNRKVFLKGSTTTRQKFNKAKQQVEKCMDWFESNKDLFSSEYLGNMGYDGENIEPKAYLVYGRRSEFEENPEQRDRRAKIMQRDGTEITSYDRLRFRYLSSSWVTVKYKGQGKYAAKKVQPLFEMSPAFAKGLPYVENYKEAIKSSTRIPSQRRNFLMERADYWKEWASQDTLGTYRTLDSE